MTTEPTPRDLIAAELDKVLTEQIAAQKEHRAAQNVEREAMRRATEIAGRAQRLRLALFALDGEKSEMNGSYRNAEANAANNERIRELQRGGAR